MNFDFLIFPDLEELYLVGPWEIITAWKGHQGGPDRLSYRRLLKTEGQLRAIRHYA